MVNKKSQNSGMNDEMLDSVGQQAVRKIVQALPEDSLSMAWRSSLNERLVVAVAQKQKKKRMAWIVRPALGLSLATVFALIVMFQPSWRRSMATPDRGIESAIMSDHHNSVLLNDVGNAGLNANEVTSEANPEDPDDDMWSDADAQSL
jgi:hypothetical protein